MNIDSLRRFAMLAGSLNYTVTARQMHISQPGLSKSIKELEKEMGVKLFSREGELKLTTAGIFFLEKAEEILHEYQQMVDGCKRLASDERWTLSIIYPIGVDETYDIVIGAYKDLHARHPYADIAFAAQDKTPFFHKLREGKADVGVVSLFRPGLTSIAHPEEGNFDLRLFHMDDAELWVDPGQPLNEKDVIAHKDLESIPLFTGVNPPLDLHMISMRDLEDEWGLSLHLYTRPTSNLEELVGAAEYGKGGVLLSTRGVVGLKSYLRPAMTLKTRFNPPLPSYQYFVYRSDDEDNELLMEFMDIVDADVAKRTLRRTRTEG